MIQNPPRYPPYEAPPRPPRRKLRVAVFLAVLTLLFFGVFYLVSPEPDIEVQQGLAFAEVDGLGGRYLAARAAYAYDPDGHRVLAMNATGDVLSIGLDDTKAVAVDAPTAATWASRLSADPNVTTPPAATRRKLSWARTGLCCGTCRSVRRARCWCASPLTAGRHR